jgi:hypothetical protein
MMGGPMPAPTSTTQPFHAPTAPDCSTPEQGCTCTQEGETVACEGPVLKDGDFVTCEGARACFHGAWGPCIPPTTHSVP